ncbi:DNA-binding transcriptional regulator HexR [Castellaniella daejeonensis]|jgi:RpiR family carbohydrate utilization transcriptional regulator|uniref:DNA-binding transcriptional regulator HexR n=1 Tax=Castellaniella daejeonensis TaxID=659013 RepID=A0ABP3DKN7_9BURK
MNTSILPELRARLPSLSRAAARVARLAIAHPGDVARMTIGEIARAAEVSEPTVIRFCRALGLAGWPDFKVRLAASLMAGGVPYVHSSLKPDESVAGLAGKVFDNAVSALLRVRDGLDPAAVESAIGLLARARRIEFYGVGNSGIVAADAQHKFFRFDLPVAAYSDSHVQAMAASLLGPDDVLTAISHSGRSRELLEAVGLARANGCPIIAITASGTPLAEAATLHLRADTQEDTALYSPMISRLAHLAIIDVLALGVALRRGDQASRVLEKTKKSLIGKRRP